MTVDRWGRSLTCPICGARLAHPKNGRPRKNCGAKPCQAAMVRHRRLVERIEQETAGAVRASRQAVEALGRLR